MENLDIFRLSRKQPALRFKEFFAHAPRFKIQAWEMLKMALGRQRGIQFESWKTGPTLSPSEMLD